MPFTAHAISVMIASPGDVETERSIIRSTVHEWNAVNAKDRRMVLIPTGWDTHASPEMGDRAQEIINKQVLDDCDLLVAVFWTRLGSPTGKAPSGTIEEIERHISEGRPAMLYFSNKPVHPDSVDPEQYSALRTARADYQKRGLVESYDSISEFQTKFTRQLAQSIIRSFAELSAESAGQFHSEEAPSGPRTSDSARLLLLEAAQDNSGEVLCLSVIGGLIVEVNGKQVSKMGDPRDEAKWRSAIDELVAQGLLEPVGYEGQLFRVTSAGYDFADQLRGAEA